MDMTKEYLDRLLTLSRERPDIIEPKDGGDQFLISADNKPVDLSAFFKPNRIKQHVTLLDAQSFIAYVNTYKSKEGTAIFANVGNESATFKAVLDYHSSTPEFCSHVAEFKTQITPEWQTWLSANRKPMGQVEFATWLEDNLSLFVSPEGSGAPSGAELLELVTTLNGHQNATFNSSLRLKNGAYSVSYDESIEVKGTIVSRGDSLELPPRISAGIKLFHGCPAYQVDARLKTGIKERKLTLWFETIGLPQMVRENLLNVVEQVEEQTKIKAYIGSNN